MTAILRPARPATCDGAAVGQLGARREQLPGRADRLGVARRAACSARRVPRARARASAGSAAAGTAACRRTNDRLAAVVGAVRVDAVEGAVVAESRARPGRTDRSTRALPLVGLRRAIAIASVCGPSAASVGAVRARERARQLAGVLRRAVDVDLSSPAPLGRDDEPAELLVAARPAIARRRRTRASAIATADHARACLAFSTSRVNQANVIQRLARRARTPRDDDRRLRVRRRARPPVGQLRERLHLPLAADRRVPEWPLRRRRRARTASSASKPIALVRQRPAPRVPVAARACRDCKAAFSARYLIVEALTGALFGLAWWFDDRRSGATVRAVRRSRSIRFAIDGGVLLRDGRDHVHRPRSQADPQQDHDSGDRRRSTRATLPAARAPWYDGLIGAGDRLRRAVADRRDLLPHPQARGPRPRRQHAARAGRRAARLARRARVAVRRLGDRLGDRHRR